MLADSRTCGADGLRRQLAVSVTALAIKVRHLGRSRPVPRAGVAFFWCLK